MRDERWIPIRIVRAPPSWLNHLPKAPPPNAIPLGVRFQYMNLGGHNHSVYSTGHMLVPWSLPLPHWGHDLSDTILYFLLSPANAPGLIPNAPSLDACACVVQALQSCLTLCGPMGCSPAGSSVHGILLARVLEWVAMTSSRAFSQLRDWTGVSCASCITGRFFIHWAILGAPRCSSTLSYPWLPLSRLPRGSAVHSPSVFPASLICLWWPSPLLSSL